MFDESSFTCRFPHRSFEYDVCKTVQLQEWPFANCFFFCKTDYRSWSLLCEHGSAYLCNYSMIVPEGTDAGEAWNWEDHEFPFQSQAISWEQESYKLPRMSEGDRIHHRHLIQFHDKSHLLFVTWGNSGSSIISLAIKSETVHALWLWWMRILWPKSMLPLIILIENGNFLYQSIWWAQCGCQSELDERVHWTLCRSQAMFIERQERRWRFWTKQCSLPQTVREERSVLDKTFFVPEAGCFQCTSFASNCCGKSFVSARCVFWSAAYFPAPKMQINLHVIWSCDRSHLSLNSPGSGAFVCACVSFHSLLKICRLPSIHRRRHREWSRWGDRPSRPRASKFWRGGTDTHFTKWEKQKRLKGCRTNVAFLSPTHVHVSALDFSTRNLESGVVWSAIWLWSSSVRFCVFSKGLTSFLSRGMWKGHQQWCLLMSAWLDSAGQECLPSLLLGFLVSLASCCGLIWGYTPFVFVRIGVSVPSGWHGSIQHLILCFWLCICI